MNKNENALSRGTQYYWKYIDLNDLEIVSLFLIIVQNSRNFFSLDSKM